MRLEGDEGARRLIGALSPGELVEVEAPDTGVTFDIDTPEDLAAPLLAGRRRWLLTSFPGGWLVPPSRECPIPARATKTKSPATTGQAGQQRKSQPSATEIKANATISSNLDSLSMTANVGLADTRPVMTAPTLDRDFPAEDSELNSL